MGRAFLRSRRSQGHNVAMLYLDLTEAFYRILRPLVVGGVPDDELVMHVGARLGLSEDLMSDLYAHLAEPSALERAHLPQHLRNALHALHEDTHFHVRGQLDTCRTALGSRPGDCFADVIFSYLWGRILLSLESKMEELGLREDIKVEQGLRLPDAVRAHEVVAERQFLGPTWMDDTCVCVSDRCPERLERKITQATSQLLGLCESHGLSPNLQPGKSEVLFAFQGRGSNAMKLRYFGPHSDGALTIVGEMGIAKVKVVNKYTHLGCVIHHRSDNRDEARRRIGIAQQAFTQHRRHLLCNPDLTLRRRVELFRTLILSRFCYGTESWTFSTLRCRLRVHSALLRLFRRLLRMTHDVHLSDDEILAATELSSPTELLRIARLRYLGTLYRCRDTVPWGLLNDDLAWTALVADDLHWMWQQLKGASMLGDPQEHFTAWENLWMHHHSYWKRLVRRAGIHAVRQRCNQMRVLHFHRQLVRLFHEVDGEGEHFPLHVPLGESCAGADDQPHACMCCKMIFKSRGGVGAHLFKVHQVVAKVRLLFDQTHCGACLREFHTMGKLKDHLLYARDCREELWGRRQIFRPVTGRGSTMDVQRERQHDGVLPPLQGAGPKLPARNREAIPEHDLELAENIYLGILENEGRLSVRDVICETVFKHPISWAGCQATLRYLHEELTFGDIEHLQIQDFDIKRLLRELCAPAEWAFLQGHGDDREEAGKSGTLEDIEQQCMRRLEHGEPRPVIWQVPRPMMKERYIIHAFSGRRRPGDFQFFVEEAQRLNNEATIHTISVDIMVDPIWGNVAKPEVREFWLAAARDRHVVGAMAGPPCETWSQARGRQTPADEAKQHRAPRVLREMEAIWGLPSLAIRELLQLDTGNLLLLFTLELLVTLAIAGGIGGLEHPAAPEDPSKVSIWRLPILAYLLTWPEFHLIELSQGLWGAPTRSRLASSS